MPLKIVPASEPIHVEQIVLTLYAPPGVGKTSLASSADAPLLLDTDRGSYRSAFRPDSVQPGNWGEVAGITKADVADYRTLVIDTAGRALDLLTADIIASNPKLGRGGALTLQGYGELKTRFAAFLKLVRGFGLDVVLVAHSDEKMQGDDLIERIDMQGGSKQEVYKVSDAMARLAIMGGQRVLTFSPTDTSFGKDPANIGRVEIPDLSREPQFLAGIIARIKDTLNALSEEQKEAAEKAERRALEWSAAVGLCRDATDFDQLIPNAQTDAEKRELLQAAEKHGFAYDKRAKAFKATAGAA